MALVPTCQRTRSGRSASTLRSRRARIFRGSPPPPPRVRASISLPRNCSPRAAHAAIEALDRHLGKLLAQLGLEPAGIAVGAGGGADTLGGRGAERDDLEPAAFGDPGGGVGNGAIEPHQAVRRRTVGVRARRANTQETDRKST